jgi:hypothetical protein
MRISAIGVMTIQPFGQTTSFDAPRGLVKNAGRALKFHR